MAMQRRVLLSATVIDVLEGSVTYAACPECYSKLTQGTCPKCGFWYTQSEISYRYRLCLAVCDGSAVSFVTAFGGMLNLFFGTPASDFQQKYVCPLENQLGSLSTNTVKAAVEETFAGRTLVFGLKISSPLNPRCAAGAGSVDKDKGNHSVLTLQDIIEMTGVGADMRNNFVATQVLPQTSPQTRQTVSHHLDVLMAVLAREDANHAVLSSGSDEAQLSLLLHSFLREARPDLELTESSVSHCPLSPEVSDVLSSRSSPSDLDHVSVALSCDNSRLSSVSFESIDRPKSQNLSDSRIHLNVKSVSPNWRNSSESFRYTGPSTPLELDKETNDFCDRSQDDFRKKNCLHACSHRQHSNDRSLLGHGRWESGDVLDLHDHLTCHVHTFDGGPRRSVRLINRELGKDLQNLRGKENTHQYIGRDKSCSLHDQIKSRRHEFSHVVNAGVLKAQPNQENMRSERAKKDDRKKSWKAGQTWCKTNHFRRLRKMSGVCHNKFGGDRSKARLTHDSKIVQDVSKGSPQLRLKNAETCSSMEVLRNSLSCSQNASALIFTHAACGGDLSVLCRTQDRSHFESSSDRYGFEDSPQLKNKNMYSSDFYRLLKTNLKSSKESTATIHNEKSATDLKETSTSADNEDHDCNMGGGNSTTSVQGNYFSCFPVAKDNSCSQTTNPPVAVTCDHQHNVSVRTVCESKTLSLKKQLELQHSPTTLQQLPSDPAGGRDSCDVGGGLNLLGAAISPMGGHHTSLEEMPESEDFDLFMAACAYDNVQPVQMTGTLSVSKEAQSSGNKKSSGGLGRNICDPTTLIQVTREPSDGSTEPAGGPEGNHNCDVIKSPQGVDAPSGHNGVWTSGLMRTFCDSISSQGLAPCAYNSLTTSLQAMVTPSDDNTDMARGKCDNEEDNARERNFSQLFDETRLTDAYAQSISANVTLRRHCTRKDRKKKKTSHVTRKSGEAVCPTLAQISPCETLESTDNFLCSAVEPPESEDMWKFLEDCEPASCVSSQVDHGVEGRSCVSCLPFPSKHNLEMTSEQLGRIQNTKLRGGIGRPTAQGIVNFDSQRKAKERLSVVVKQSGAQDGWQCDLRDRREKSGETDNTNDCVSSHILQQQSLSFDEINIDFDHLRLPSAGIDQNECRTLYGSAKNGSEVSRTKFLNPIEVTCVRGQSRKLCQNFLSGSLADRPDSSLEFVTPDISSGFRKSGSNGGVAEVTTAQYHYENSLESSHMSVCHTAAPSAISPLPVVCNIQSTTLQKSSNPPLCNVRLSFCNQSMDLFASPGGSQQTDEPGSQSVQNRTRPSYSYVNETSTIFSSDPDSLSCDKLKQNSKLSVCKRVRFSSISNQLHFYHNNSSCSGTSNVTDVRDVSPAVQLKSCLKPQVTLDNVAGECSSQDLFSDRSSNMTTEYSQIGCSLVGTDDGNSPCVTCDVSSPDLFSPSVVSESVPGCVSVSCTDRSSLWHRTITSMAIPSSLVTFDHSPVTTSERSTASHRWRLLTPKALFTPRSHCPDSLRPTGHTGVAQAVRDVVQQDEDKNSEDLFTSPISPQPFGQASIVCEDGNLCSIKEIYPDPKEACSSPDLFI
ncbi:uncharacterized protein LOC101847533 [Aplysia californica]|uniref:Uncharacterized protein LOC101847533 n=1 Tax=Aplysia californica TaxID=6500 RepID=A0ABM0K6A8_APLCA|nr:uncharacterized protein LOC101847533 [Aplysia californica]XP_005109733.1 uncharacterized protein LOC101847533 [Aplysia californica]